MAPFCEPRVAMTEWGLDSSEEDRSDPDLNPDETHPHTHQGAYDRHKISAAQQQPYLKSVLHTPAQPASTTTPGFQQN